MLLARLLVCLCLVACERVLASKDIIKESDGGYVNVIVAIHRSVPENSNLIQKIKDIFVRASPALHKATFGGAYFKNVIIVVPSTWHSHSSYENATEDLYPRAQFKVDGPTSKYGHEPYTLHDKGCGEPGLYTHWTPSYLQSDFVSKWQFKKGEKKEMRLVQEWSQLRYGIFEEHGYPGDPSNPAVYRENGELHITKCGVRNPGLLNITCSADNPTGKQEGNATSCSFVVSTLKPRNTSASLMFTASVPGVDYFCDETKERRHDSRSPNKQNQMCDGRSTWSIIKDHPDFNNAQTKRLMALYSRQKRETGPTSFSVVRTPGVTDARVVLVLDTSGSMKGRRMELLHSAASRALVEHVPDGSRVGIVAFSTIARVLVPLTEVTRDNRRQLAGMLPKTDDQGSTSIGKGLLKGLDVITASGTKSEGSRIILVTDGEENVGPRIQEIIPLLVHSGVQVMAVAFGVKATEMLEQLVLATKGNVFFFPDLNGRSPTSALDSAFLESTSVLLSDDQQPIRLIQERLHLDKDGRERHMLVEDGLAKDLVITLTAFENLPLSVGLTDPNGVIIGEHQFHLQKDNYTQHLRIEIPTPVKGLWKLTVLSMTGSGFADLSVLAKPRNLAASYRQPKLIRIRAWVDDIQPHYPSAVRILAQVVKGGHEPVMDATVVAVVTRPNNKSIHVSLRDNGAGADVTRGDGIYSGYFTQFTGNGRYAVFVRMITYQDEKRNEGLVRSKRGSSPKARRVERVADAGSFRLDNWSRKDTIPPSKVTNLVASWSYQHPDSVFLDWTAPGNDMDYGRVSRMEIRIAHDPDTLRQTFNSCRLATDWLEHNLTLVRGGEHQRIELTFPEGEDRSALRSRTFYFALRSWDQAGNMADISNVALATFNPEDVTSQALQGGESKILVPLVAGACALLVAIALSGLLLMIYTRRKEHKLKTHYFDMAEEYAQKSNDMF